MNFFLTRRGCSFCLGCSVASFAIESATQRRPGWLIYLAAASALNVGMLINYKGFLDD